MWYSELLISRQRTTQTFPSLSLSHSRCKHQRLHQLWTRTDFERHVLSMSWSRQWRALTSISLLWESLLWGCISGSKMGHFGMRSWGLGWNNSDTVTPDAPFPRSLCPPTFTEEKTKAIRCDQGPLEAPSAWNFICSSFAISIYFLFYLTKKQTPTFPILTGRPWPRLWKGRLLLVRSGWGPAPSLSSFCVEPFGLGE